MGKYPFPYKNFNDMVKDKAAKLGAGDAWQEELMSLLGMGYYQKMTRKARNATISLVNERLRDDPRFQALYKEVQESLTK